MKKFGKKILALIMALMCLATVGAVSASAASSNVAHNRNYSSPYSSVKYYSDNSKYTDRSRSVYKSSAKPYQYHNYDTVYVDSGNLRKDPRYDVYTTYGVRNGQRTMLDQHKQYSVG